MNLTNNAGLHPLHVRAIEAQARSHPTRESEKAFASATTLMSPPTIVALQEHYAGQLPEEAEDRLYALGGWIIHNILAEAAGPGHSVEQRFSFEFDGEKITGGYDAVVDASWLSDHKYTTIYALGNKARLKEWEAQLNIYRYGQARNGVKIHRMTNELLFRDWSVTKAKWTKGYPQHQWARIEVPIWPDARVETLLRERIARLRAARATPVAELPECSEAERWQRDHVWKVKKRLGGRAVAGHASHKTEKLAQRAAVDLQEKDAAKGKRQFYVVEESVGHRMRCELYCLPGKCGVCPHWKGGE